MSERKVLNKYYPPDFDPAKIPRLHLPKDRQYTVRLMAPCNMRCKTCGEYIYKGKKFNARKETVQGEDYLGIKVFRFYIKCTRCLAEITFKTDPQNADYIVEHGATRNFQALKLAEEQAEREQKELEEEEANNPMKLLENRTKASKYEMEILESLEELKDINQRQANVDFDKLLKQNSEITKKIIKRQDEEDEALIRSVFGQPDDEIKADRSVAVKRLLDDSSSDEECWPKTAASSFISESPSNILIGDLASKANAPETKKSKMCSERGSGSFFSKKENIGALIRTKKDSKENETQDKKDCNQPQKNLHVKSNALTLLGDYSDSDSDQ